MAAGAAAAQAEDHQDHREQGSGRRHRALEHRQARPRRAGRWRRCPAAASRSARAVRAGRHLRRGLRLMPGRSQWRHLGQVLVRAVPAAAGRPPLAAGADDTAEPGDPCQPCPARRPGCCERPACRPSRPAPGRGLPACCGCQPARPGRCCRWRAAAARVRRVRSPSVWMPSWRRLLHARLLRFSTSIGSASSGVPPARDGHRSPSVFLRSVGGVVGRAGAGGRRPAWPPGCRRRCRSACRRPRPSRRGRTGRACRSRSASCAR